MIPQLLEVVAPPRQGDKEFFFSVRVYAPHPTPQGHATHVSQTFTYPIGETTSNQALESVLDDIVEWYNRNPTIQRVHRGQRVYRKGRDIVPVERIILT